GAGRDPRRRNGVPPRGSLPGCARAEAGAGRGARRAAGEPSRHTVARARAQPAPADPTARGSPGRRVPEALPGWLGILLRLLTRGAGLRADHAAARAPRTRGRRPPAEPR